MVSATVRRLPRMSHIFSNDTHEDRGGKAEPLPQYWVYVSVPAPTPSSLFIEETATAELVTTPPVARLYDLTSDRKLPLRLPKLLEEVE